MNADRVRFWYQKNLSLTACLLLPFSWLFRWVSAARRFAYQKNIFKVTAFPVPVIVVGNLTVGGTGKTPLVIWLANWLRAQGYRPGIVSRGAGGKTHREPHVVQLTDDPAIVGDEALLLKRRADCPVVVGVHRVAAVKTVLSQFDCNVVLSDDGLQHYALARDIEIVVVDAERQWGNGQLLPAGPLREPLTRLSSVDFVLQNGKEGEASDAMRLCPLEVVSLRSGETLPLSAFHGKTVHAMAGIGHPERFFRELTAAGIQVVPHAFPDHHAYQSADLAFDASYPLLMTEKDAVKCVSFAKDHFYYLRIAAEPNVIFQQALRSKCVTLF